MKYIIGNWKSNKNIREVQSWLDSFTSHDLSIFKSGVNAVIAPPYPFILMVREALSEYPWIKVGSQDISQFGAGTYTGAVSAHNLDNIISYTIIGHSERRKHFGETNATVESKTEFAQSVDIEPIVCVRGPEDDVPKETKYIAYEPPGSISKGSGEGDAATVESIVEMKRKLGVSEKQIFIYGGSVNPGNIREYLKSTEIDGVLLGGASLDAQKFYDMCTATASI